MNNQNHYLNLKSSKRADFFLIKKWIKKNETVLDLGCENGDLLKLLWKKRNITPLGIEIKTDNVNQCLSKGVNVIQANLDDGLDLFDDSSFDVVIMTETIQALHNPVAVLKEMMRVGRRCIITFPNFANLSVRSYLFFKGQMPITKELTYEWHNTPNIHFCTVNDFEKTCKQNEIEIISRKFIGNFSNSISGNLVSRFPNLLAKTALYQLKSK